MCHSNEHITLSESKNCQISWCKGCKSYSVLYKSCCLSFIQDEIAQFRDMLANLQESDFNYEFLGHQHAIVKNKYTYMGICLAKNDVDNLLGTVNRAISLNEAFQIIYK